MTSTTDIITRAYRESNLLALGATPTTPQQNEAISILDAAVQSVIGSEVGEPLSDWLVGTNNIDQPDPAWQQTSWKYPLQNSRIFLCHTQPETLILPIDPDNGASIQIVDVYNQLATYNVTVQANGRTIENAAQLVLNTNGTNKTWIFNANTCNWDNITTPVAIGAQMPFPSKFDDYFVIKLAGRLNPRYGRSLSDVQIATLQDLEAQLEAEYRQHRAPPAPLATRRLTDPGRRMICYPRNGKFGWMR